jgi:cytochrome c553
LILVGCGDDKTKKEEPKKVEIKKEVVAEKKVEPKAPVAVVKPVEAPKKVEVTGKSLYMKCQACHGADGKTIALGKSAKIAGWDKAKILEALKGYKAGTRNVYGMGGTMVGQAGMLSDTDMGKVADYISGL